MNAFQAQPSAQQPTQSAQPLTLGQIDATRGRDFYTSGTRLLGGKSAPMQGAAAAPTSAPASTPTAAPAPAPMPAQPQSFGGQMNSVFSQIRNSSDDAGAMQSAFQGLSMMLPDMSKQVQGMPPEQQNRVLASYVNAVRSGSQFNAHEAAAAELKKVQTEQAAATAAAAPAAKPKPTFKDLLKTGIKAALTDGRVYVRQGSGSR